MVKKTQHVIKNTKSGWAVKKGGASRYTESYRTQQQAIDYGIKIAKKQNAEFYIHTEDGRVGGKELFIDDEVINTNV